jgi:formylglycine-generating enzyme
MRSAALLALMACSSAPRELPPRGQLVLYFDTDAPVTGSATVLFDRLRVDVAACEGCDPVARDFTIDADAFRARRVSIGVVNGGIVRARLYLLEGNLETEPPPDVTIDITAALPMIPAEGLVERTLFLPTERAGEEGARGELSEGGPSKVGTWPGAQKIDCLSPPRAGEVCVPGGAFWMGTARMRDFRLWLDPAAEARRLVVLSPYYIDAHEVTVGELRATKTTALEWSGSRIGDKDEDWCTFTKSPAANEALPANCITRTAAIAHCAALGKQLPTEAQFEYVASNLGRSLWPYGNDVPSCTDAVLARAKPPIDVGDFTSSTACPQSKVVAAPAVAGTGARDRVDLPSGTVLDLVGNLSEHTRDIYQYRSDSCWSRRGVYTDPTCDHYGTSVRAFLVKGGNHWWQQGLSFAQMRWPTGDAPDPIVGFRCVRVVN